MFQGKKIFIVYIKNKYNNEYESIANEVTVVHKTLPLRLNVYTCS